MSDGARPSYPPQPESAILAAMAEVPRILSDFPFGEGGHVEVMGTALGSALKSAGHTLAAACWAVDRLVKAGKLEHRYEDRPPVVFSVNGQPIYAVNDCAGPKERVSVLRSTTLLWLEFADSEADDVSTSSQLKLFGDTLAGMVGELAMWRTLTEMDMSSPVFVRAVEGAIEPRTRLLNELPARFLELQQSYLPRFQAPHGLKAAEFEGHHGTCYAELVGWLFFQELWSHVLICCDRNAWLKNQREPDNHPLPQISAARVREEWDGVSRFLRDLKSLQHDWGHLEALLRNEWAAVERGAAKKAAPSIVRPAASVRANTSSAKGTAIEPAADLATSALELRGKYISALKSAEAFRPTGDQVTASSTGPTVFTPDADPGELREHLRIALNALVEQLNHDGCGADAELLMTYLVALVGGSQAEEETKWVAAKPILKRVKTTETSPPMDLISTDGLATLAGIERKTLLNKLAVARQPGYTGVRPPKPAVSGGGNHDQYSYSAVRRFMVHAWPRRAAQLPESFDDVKRILAAK